MVFLKRYKLLLGLIFTLCFIAYSVIRLYDKLDYFIPLVISLINIAVVLWFLTYRYAKKFVIYIFFLYGIVTLQLPILIILYEYPLEEINQYFQYRQINIDHITIANLYILLFYVLVIIFLFLFLKNKSISKWNISKLYLTNSSKTILIVILLVIAYISKLYLMKTGVWFFYEMNSVDTQSNAFINYAQILEKLDILVMLYFVFKYKMKKLTKFEMTIFLSVLIISILFAIPSTSKGRILTLLFPLFIMSVYAKNKILLLFGSLILISSLGNLFDTMTYLRNNPSETITKAILASEVIFRNKGMIADNKVLTRVDYQTVLANVFKTYPTVPNKFRFDYIDNIIGLIPRVLWKDKPIIGMDMNKIGYEIGLLRKSDLITHVGITPIGVAYYELGIFGIVFIALMTTILLYFFASKLDTNYWIGFLLSIMIAIQLARNGTYTNIVPSIIQIFIVFFVVGLLLSNKYTNEKKFKLKI